MFKEYSKDDFSEIKCTDINTLNKNMEEKEKIQSKNRSNIKKDSEFRKIITINLKEKSKQNVLNAILNNVDEIEGLESYCLTGGRLNARKALASVEEDIISYSYYNDNLHSISCACRGLQYEPHTWELVQMSTYAVINPIVRTYACRFCGATKLE